VGKQVSDLGGLAIFLPFVEKGLEDVPRRQAVYAGLFVQESGVV
jgi:hypothetical protein